VEKNPQTNTTSRDTLQGRI